MKKILLFVFISANFLFASYEIFAQNQADELRAVQTVETFYRFHFSRNSIFNEKEIALRRRFFSQRLQRLLAAELKRERIYLNKYPTNKPFFDVLPFQPIELCKKDYRVSTAQTTRRTAKVRVNFIYSKSSCDANDGTQIFYKILLSKIAGKWLIDDVIYDNGSTLTEDFNKAQKIQL